MKKFKLNKQDKYNIISFPLIKISPSIAGNQVLICGNETTVDHDSFLLRFQLVLFNTFVQAKHENRVVLVPSVNAIVIGAETHLWMISKNLVVLVAIVIIY